MTDYKLTELIIEYSDSEDERADNEPDLTECEHVSHGIRFTYYVGNGYNIYCKVCACQKMIKNKS